MSTIANNTVFPADSREAGDFSGLTKREYFAVMAMRAICANSTFISAICDLANKNNTHAEKLVASSSVELAKALIAELNKEEK